MQQIVPVPVPSTGAVDENRPLPSAIVVKVANISGYRLPRAWT